MHCFVPVPLLGCLVTYWFPTAVVELVRRLANSGIIRMSGIPCGGFPKPTEDKSSNDDATRQEDLKNLLKSCQSEDIQAKTQAILSLRCWINPASDDDLNKHQRNEDCKVFADLGGFTVLLEAMKTASPKTEGTFWLFVWLTGWLQTARSVCWHVLQQAGLCQHLQ